MVDDGFKSKVEGKVVKCVINITKRGEGPFFTSSWDTNLDDVNNVVYGEARLASRTSTKLGSFFFKKSNIIGKNDPQHSFQHNGVTHHIKRPRIGECMIFALSYIYYISHLYTKLICLVKIIVQTILCFIYVLVGSHYVSNNTQWISYEWLWSK